jgi:hypothetical protein
VRDLLLLYPLVGGGCADGSLVCGGRWVAASPNGRHYSRHPVWRPLVLLAQRQVYLEDHWMIIPVLRVFGCAQGRDGTLAGLLVATDWDVRPEALPTQRAVDCRRMPSRLLSRRFMGIGRVSRSIVCCRVVLKALEQEVETRRLLEGSNS